MDASLSFAHTVSLVECFTLFKQLLLLPPRAVSNSIVQNKTYCKHAKSFLLVYFLLAFSADDLMPYCKEIIVPSRITIAYIGWPHKIDCNLVLEDETLDYEDLGLTYDDIHPVTVNFFLCKFIRTKNFILNTISS